MTKRSSMYSLSNTVAISSRKVLRLFGSSDISNAMLNRVVRKRKTETRNLQQAYDSTLNGTVYSEHRQMAPCGHNVITTATQQQRPNVNVKRTASDESSVGLFLPNSLLTLPPPVIVDTSSRLSPLSCPTIPQDSIRNSDNSVQPLQFLNELDESALLNLLALERVYYPNTGFLLHVNSEAEDKVNASLRDEAVTNLRLIHNIFFGQPASTFIKAVGLVDRFLVKVKVKPRYMGCVACACYYLAFMEEQRGQSGEVNSSRSPSPGAIEPTPASLVELSQCGGTAADLERMADIVRSKLLNDYSTVTAPDFLQTLIPPGYHRDGTVQHLISLAELALCFVDTSRFRPACLALGLLFSQQSRPLAEELRPILVDVYDLVIAAALCQVEWEEVMSCADAITSLWCRHSRTRPPASRERLVWTLSKRTVANMSRCRRSVLTSVAEETPLWATRCSTEAANNCHLNEEDFALDLLFAS